MFVILPEHGTLFPGGRTNMTIAEAASLPLIVPTGEHGLRRRIAAEFEHRNLSMHIVAEIDSLSLVMNCVYAGIAATIKPMAAVFLEGERGRHWRALSISDARMNRRNYLYSLPPNRLSAAASVVAAELRQTVRELVASGAWAGVQSIDPEAGSGKGELLAPTRSSAGARPDGCGASPASPPCSAFATLHGSGCDRGPRLAAVPHPEIHCHNVRVPIPLGAVPGAQRRAS